ncbi:DUF6804 family protein [Naasia lichenicola]|uniref:Uncharacterized protein n=1 Tax=Naasia lichenicola TaxID=2565933 RepID=A0A4S4FH57_9MICO|nr:DUF6804 family protein [Naasia lichenicola]THG29629.1 hypothetical protein E6C64_13210 [Naasia lichenicola]
MPTPPPRSAPLRPALLPGLIGALGLVIGAVVPAWSDWIVSSYLTSILALIIVVFAAQGRQWLWIIPMFAVAVLWNPVYPFGFSGTLWAAAHILGAAAFLATGLLMRVPPQESAGRAA